MELVNSFTVPADIDTAWKSLLDVQGVAPCMPGATLESVDGDNFTGNVKVKLGPVSMTYGGEAHFVSKDEATHVAIIEGTGKETKGAGTAKALVTTSLVAETADTTRVNVVTDLTITGKAAQFGRGVMQDVAGRIIDQFAGNLATNMAASGAAAAAAAAAPAGEGAPAPVAAPAPVKAAEAIDLGSVAVAPVLKRALPIVVGIIVVVVVLWVVFGR
ncbi:MAG: hypothetical protein F2842_01420 [Actinobacteria bacterium]|uniref:Unannotated protein n=1 Tax=freshwater metagenome TaxID=449393 RepID=A0A6J7IKE1_9ZZZZ|nr:hypothetical protein [Actinomycetota bacterium]MSW40851.1 hypothetical protein [Actinomycetota bacterium]